MKTCNNCRKSNCNLAFYEISFSFYSSRFSRLEEYSNHIFMQSSTFRSWYHWLTWSLATVPKETSTYSKCTTSSFKSLQSFLFIYLQQLIQIDLLYFFINYIKITFVVIKLTIFKWYVFRYQENGGSQIEYY